MAKNAVAVQEEAVNAVALAGAFDDVDAGFGHVDSSDFIIPRLAVLGALSPQIEEGHAKYIEGAKSGMVADVSLGEVFQGPVHFLPVMREKVQIEWKPENQGGGIVARYDYDRIAELGLERNDKNQTLTKEGNEIISYVQLYGLNLSADNRWSFAAFKKSSLKVMRQFMTKATSIRMPNGRPAPLMYKTYLLTSFDDSGNGKKWKNWKIEDGPLTMDLPNAAEVLESAKALQRSIQAGTAKADTREDDDVRSDDVPF